MVGREHWGPHHPWPNSHRGQRFWKTRQERNAHMYIVLFKEKNIVLFQLITVHSIPDYDITLKEHEIHKMSLRAVQSLFPAKQL